MDRKISRIIKEIFNQNEIIKILNKYLDFN